MKRQARNAHDGNEYDPVFIHSRRESIVLLVGFGLFFLWSTGVSYFCGYGLSGEEASRTILGIPRWVFWGVAVPWMAANVFTFWFCLFYMANDPLGQALDEQQPPESVNNAESRKDSS